MHVAIVVNDFPVVSESFILRAIEALADRGTINISIVVTGCFDRLLLKTLSPSLHAKIADHRINIIAGSDRRRRPILFKYLGASFSLLRHPRSAFLASYIWKIRGLTIIKGLHVLRLINRLSRCDVIHAQYLNIGVALCVARLFGLAHYSTPIVASIRGADISRQGIVTQRELAFISNYNLGVARCLCVSESLIQKAHDRGVPSNLLELSHSALDVNQFPFVAPRKRDDGWIFVQVGRLVEKKGYELTLEMLRRLPGVSSVKLVIVGEGPLRRRLEQKIEELQLDGQVTFAGVCSHKEALNWIAAGDLLLVPSITAQDGDCEGIPNVVKEAMLLGRVVVASDHSGLPEIVEHGVTGFVFREGNVEAYTQAVLEALRARAQWPGIVGRARTITAQTYDAGIVATKLQDLYRRVSEERESTQPPVSETIGCSRPSRR